MPKKPLLRCYDIEVYIGEGYVLFLTDTDAFYDTNTGKTEKSLTIF